MKRVLFTLFISLLVFCTIDTFAQTKKTKKAVKTLIAQPVEIEELNRVLIEEAPRFHGGGIEEFEKWIYSHIRYPDVAIENGIQGSVYASFVITKDSIIDNIKIVRGIDPALDKEVMRCIKMSPKWIPARQNGRACNFKAIIRIVFVLKY